MELLKNVIEIWKYKLKTPKTDTFSFEHIQNSNIILIKNDKDELGIIIPKTLPIPDTFKLKRFHFSYHKTIYNNDKKISYENCQVMFVENDISEEYLINVLFSILDFKNKKKIDSFDLINILKNVNDNFQIENYAFNEIVGVWGELSFLLHLLRKVKSKEKMYELVNSWEGDLSRNKIDFRFLNLKKAFEIKTSVKEERIHHISGHKQCIPPENIDNLYFISIRIKNDDTGYSCFELTTEIINLLSENDLLILFNNKMSIRNIKYCKDTTYKFSFLDTFLFKAYNTNDIELPIIPKGVYEMEWKQSFDFVNETNYDNSIKIISDYLAAGL